MASVNKLSRSIALLLVALLAGCGALPGLPGSASGTLSAQEAAGPDGAGSGFLWGVSTAGYQYEGGDVSNQWYPFVQAGRTADSYGIAADGWNRYPSDMQLARGLGCNAWRTSIEWSRIEPVEGVIDQAALAHYHQEIDTMVADGLTPVITLMHFSYPAWLDQEGGWQGPHAVDAYAKFVTLVAREFGGQVKTYLTINEPTTFILSSYLGGVFAPGYRNPLAAHAVMNNLVAAHRRAYAILHQVVPGCRVSANEYVADYHTPISIPGIDLEDWFLNQVAQPDPANPSAGPAMDFLALDYYCRVNVSVPLHLPADWAWPVDPRGFTDALEHYWQKYHLPILVAENGMATDDGAPRADGWTRSAYIVAHVKAMQQAQATGVPVLGYFVWSITDNYEWGSYAPRFGLYRVECKQGDYTRYPTDSVDAYRSIIAAGGVTPAIEASYPPPASGSLLPRLWHTLQTLGR